MIKCDEIIEADAEAKWNDEETKTILTNKSCKSKSFYFLLAFSLITIALLIPVSIYCHLIKYKGKKKHLSPFYVTNSELKEFLH